MLESIVAGILSKVLGDYIDGLESENLSLNISGGHVVLENLQIKKECLAELELPITVKEGFLGKFSLEVPWSSLNSKPAIAVIEKVFLLVGPTKPSDYDVGLVKKKHEETKKRKLQMNELLASDPTKEDKKPIVEGDEKLSYTQKLIRTVIDNFQIFVKKVHFRYEDDISNTSNEQFAMGITIESFRAESCDDSWKPKFLKNESRKFVYKIATLKNFAFYLSPKAKFLKYKNVHQLTQLMENLIYEDNNHNDDPKHTNNEFHYNNLLQNNQYLIHPINSTLKIQLNQKSNDFSVPKLIADLAFEQVVIQLKEMQFKNILYLGNYFTYYIRGIKYHKYRPDPRIRPAQDPVRWWKFALKSVLTDIKEKRAKKTWTQLSTYRHNRLHYMTLYKKKIIQKKKTSQIVLDEISRLENVLEYEDILLFRSLTEALIRKQHHDSKMSGNEKKSGGWFGGWFSKKDEDIHSLEEISFKEWQHIYKEIEFIEEKKDETIPLDYVKNKFNFFVGEGSFELMGDNSYLLKQKNRIMDESMDYTKEYKIIQAGFEGFQVEVHQRSKGELVQANIVSVAVVDYFTLLKYGETVEMVSLNDNQLLHFNDTNFFTLQLERNPLHSDADMKISLAALQSLNITFGMEIINRIVQFFNTQTNSNHLKLAANNTWDSLKESAEVQVKYALDKKKVIELQIDVVAPNVIIPSSFIDSSASMLVIELGRLSMKSDTSNRKNAIIKSGDINEIQKDFYYDKFCVNITSIHVFLTDRLHYYHLMNDQNDDNRQNYDALEFDLIEKFDINTDLYLCTVSSPDLPKLRIEGCLPKLMVLISPQKLSHLFSILRSLSGPSGENQNKRLKEKVEEMEEKATSSFRDFKSLKIPAESNDKMENLLEVKFHFLSLSLNVHSDKISVNEQSRTIVLASINKFALHFEKTSHYMKAKLKVNSLNIKDCVQSWNQSMYIISSNFEDENDDSDSYNETTDLISILYVGIPKDSPIYKSIDHSFTVQIHTLEVFVNRETIASLITYSNRCIEAMKDPNAAEKSQVNEIKEDGKEDSKELISLQAEAPPKDSILLQASIQIHQLKSTLLKEGKKFICSSITNTTIRSSIHANNEIILSGSLGNISVLDFSDDTVWRDIIINTSDEKVMEFWFETVNPDFENDTLGKVIVTLQISSVRYVFLAKFLKSLLTYLMELNQMQNLISKTTKIAKETAESVQNKAVTKLVIFDLTVANPQVIIPERSESNQSYIVANLGDISITNKFEHIDQKAMIDNILLKVSAISMYSMNRDKSPKRRGIIEDTDISILLKRAAFGNEDHKHPEFDVSIHIDDISIKLCELQFHLFMNLLSGNLSEMPSKSKDLEKLEEKLASKSKLSSKDGGDDKEEEEEDFENIINLSDSLQVIKKDFIKYKFHFSLHHTSLELLEADGIREDNTILSLLCISLSGVHLDGYMSENGKIDTTIKLKSFTIADQRPSIDSKFKNLISPYKEKESNLLTITYQKEVVGNQNATISIDTPRVILLPEFIFVVKDFALQNLNYLNKSLDEIKKKNEAASKSDDGDDDKSPSHHELQMKEKENEKEEGKDSNSDHSLNKKEEKKSTPTGIHAKIVIIDPQVCLLEDLANEDSRTIVLKQSVDLDFTMNSSGVQHSNIDINDIQVYKARVKSGDKIPILTPFNMKIQFELIPKEIMSITILFQDIDLKVSYTDFKLIMKMKDNWLSALPKSTQELPSSNDDLVIEDKNKLKKRGKKKDDVKEEKKEDETTKALSPPSSPSPSSSSPSSSPEHESQMNENLKVVFGKINLLLLNDCYDEGSSGSANTPLLNLHVKEMKSEISNWSSALQGEAKLMNMHAFYYNTTLNTNEPMIEPWDFNSSFSKTEEGSFNASLTTSDVLNMNISKSFVETLLNNLEQWQLDYYDTSSNRPVVHPFYIINETGIVLTYWITGTQKRFTIPVGEEAALNLSELSSFQRNDEIQNDLMISIQLEEDDLIPVHNLPILKRTTMIFEITSKSSLKLVYNVDFREGSRVLTFGSELLITNKTTVPLDVQLENPSLPIYQMQTIAPSSKRYLPLRYSSNNTTIKFRPNDGSFNWSSESIKTNRMRRDYIPLLFSCSNNQNKNANSESTNWLYSVDVSTNEKGGTLLFLGNLGNNLQQSNLLNSSSSSNNMMNANMNNSQVDEKAMSVSLYAPLKLENTLPVKVQYIVKGTVSDLASGIIDVGESKEIFNVLKDHRPVLLLAMDGYFYSSPLKLGVTKQSFVQIESKSKRTLSLGIDNVTSVFGSRIATIFVKYWIYNKIGSPLKYKNVQKLSVNSNDQKFIAGESEVISMKISSPPDSESKLSHSDISYSQSEQIIDINDNEIKYVKPFIFSSDGLSFRKTTTAWSNSINLKSNGGVIEVLKLSEKRIPDPSHAEQYSVSIHTAPGRYWRTNIVKIAPHYIFINKTPYQLKVKQQGCAKYASEILPSEQISFDWYTKELTKNLQIKIDNGTDTNNTENDDNNSNGEEYSWSSPFFIDAANSFQVPVWKVESNTPLYIRVTVDVNDTSVTVLFLYNEKTDFPDYRIENYSSHPIIISEVNDKHQFKLSPDYSSPFAWNSPLSQKKQLSIRIPHTTSETFVSLDKLNLYPYLSWVDSNSNRKQYLSVEVIADGPTKVLVIDDMFDNDVVKYEEKLQSLSITESSQKLEQLQAEYSKSTTKDDNNNNDDNDNDNDKEEFKRLLNIQISFGGVGFSLIDEKPQELLYLCMRKIDLMFNILEDTQSIELTLGSLQIDNQIYQTSYPIFFYSPPIENQSFFQISVLRSAKYANILYFPYFGMKMQRFEVELDEIFLLRILNFVEIITKFMAERKVEEEESQLFKTSPHFYLKENEADARSTMLYFDILHINPLSMNITFTTVGGSQDVSAGMLEKTLRAGGFLASIDNAPLRLNGLILENPFVSQSQLISRIIQHYTQQGLREFYLLLGSADVLGNPVSLVSSLGTGVYDFFHEPAEGIVTSPQDFALGVAKGTKSLVKNSVFGIFNSASKITGTISKAATTISLDDDWQRARARKMLNKPQHVGQGLKKGVMNLGSGVLGGVTGVVSQPIIGLSKEGGVGFVKGVGKGVTGLFLKPVVGVVDLITDTTEGIKNSTTYFDQEKRRERIRPPRYFGKDSILTIYDFDKSWAQFIVRTIDQSAYEKQFFFQYFHIQGTKYLFLTDLMLLILVVRSPFDVKKRARFFYNDISGIHQHHEGISLTLTNNEHILIEAPVECRQLISDSIRQFASQHLSAQSKFKEYHRIEDPKMIERFSSTNLVNSEYVEKSSSTIEEVDDNVTEESSLIPRQTLSISKSSVPPASAKSSSSQVKRNPEKQPLLKNPQMAQRRPPPPPEDTCCCCCCIC